MRDHSHTWISFFKLSATSPWKKDGGKILFLMTQEEKLWLPELVRSPIA